jgi:leader peptidase (prepilin peptidase) / N-methyltransferase
MADQLPAQFWAVVVFVFGAVVGSFLNVCIHRWPREESIIRPPSHCPQCNKPLRWYHNIPLLSWIALRGRCAFCGARISPIYFIVELLNAALWVLVWLKFGFSAHAAAYMVLVSLFLIGMFVDFEHYILPDEVTIGGAVAGVIFCTVFPELQRAATWKDGLLRAVIGAGAGGALLYAVRWFGGLIFGRKVHEFDPPVTVIFAGGWLRLDDGKEPAEERLKDVLTSRRERWQFQADSGMIGDDKIDGLTVRLTLEELSVGGRSWPTESSPRLVAVTKRIEMPREAMGLGDVKLMMAIGAFFGWPAVLFSLIASSVLGSVVGISLILFGQRGWGGHIPYGPYIIIAAFAWIFFGPEVVRWYAGALMH